MEQRPAGRLWLGSLDVADQLSAVDHHDWLSDDERGRLRLMTSPVRRRSFLAGHWQVRTVAADWLQVDMARIALHRHADGRPLLLVDGTASALSVSLSHSDEWLAIALATVPVGVDVELPRRTRDLDALARFTFSPDEVERLRGVPEAQRAQAFHVTWTLKEARGKRLGEGLLPGRARLVTASPSDAEEAEALSWPLAGGALAIAIDARTDLVLQGMAAFDRPAYWRYRATAGGRAPIAQPAA